MHTLLDRRTFLQTSLLSGASLALSPNTSAFALHATSAARPQKIVVVGAGIAGLIAAFELMQSGHYVTLFEARMRPGGRIHTMRDQFSDGLYAEAGAFDFGESYTTLNRYIRMFDLSLEQMGAAEKNVAANDVFYLQGKRYVVPQGTSPDWPYGLSPEDRKLGPQGLWEKYVGSRVGNIQEPLSPGWPDRAATSLDALTVNEIARKNGATDAVLSMLRLTFLGEDFDYVSALEDIAWQRFFDSGEIGSKLRGGNDQLPKAFAQKLGPRIHYGAAVRKVSQNKDRVTLSVSRAGEVAQVEADRVVLAIPFSVLRDVELDSSISSQKRNVISKLRYVPITRVYLQSRTRFWLDKKHSGYASTDLPIRTILDFTEAQPGARAIVGTENSGLNAQLAAAMKPEERLRWGLENVSKVFPEMAENFEGGTSIVWSEEPWSMGGSAYFAPAEMTTMFPHVATVEGRVHFAGEHTSTLFVMEGAARSGVRAVNEINAASN